jgi:hypothetical protein
VARMNAFGLTNAIARERTAHGAPATFWQLRQSRASP